jgi:hypothetical protein
MAFRKGQWVKLVRDLEIGGATEPAGTVGIHVKELTGASEVHLVRASGGVERRVRERDGVTEVLEIPYRGGDTRKVCAIAAGDLVAVVDRNDLPAERLATYAADWQPQP